MSKARLLNSEPDPLAFIDDDLARAIGRDAIMGAVLGFAGGGGSDGLLELSREASLALDGQRPTDALGLIWRLSKVWETLIDDLGGWQEAKGAVSFAELQIAIKDALSLATSRLALAGVREADHEG